MEIPLKITVLLYLICLDKVILMNNVKNSKDSEEKFIATSVWKEIKPGQKVPSGLHYRINLSTGKKEAKILDQKMNHHNDEKETGFILSKNIENNKNSESILQSDSMEQVLKDVNKKNPENDMPRKFRTLDEIIKDLDNLNIRPKTDVEILQELFHKYEEEDKKKRRKNDVIIKLLQDFQQLSHQIDNGVEFQKMNGFKKVVYKELNSTNNVAIIKQEVLKLFSTLAQNNPKVKIHILETGGVTLLLRILNLEKNEYVKNSAITALSCTLRTFPFAQNKFIESGGLEIFTSLFKTERVKLKLKIVTLLSDLIIERHKDRGNFENHELRIIDIENELYSSGWCNNLNELLENLFIIDINDFDSIEKCLTAMNSIKNKCRHSYNMDIIRKLYNHYKSFEKNDEEFSSYYQELSNLAFNILEKNVNDEL